MFEHEAFDYVVFYAIAYLTIYWGFDFGLYIHIVDYNLSRRYREIQEK